MIDARTSSIAQCVGNSSTPAVSNWRLFIFFFLVLALCYSTVLLTPYAVADDYGDLFAAWSGRAKWLIQLRVAGGRPVHALITALLYQLCSPEIGNLRYVRVFTVAVMAVLACCLYRTMLITGWNRCQSVVIALTIVTLPPFQVYAAWAETASYPIAAVTAAGAFYMVERSLQETLTPRKWSAVSLSVLLMFLALINFQPGAMFFWTFGALVIFRPGTTAFSELRRLISYAGISAVSLILAYGVYRLGVAKYGFLMHGTRIQLTSNIAEKALWFFRAPMINSLNLFLISPNPWFAVGVAIFASVGLILYLCGSLRERLCTFIVALLFLPLSYLPNLVIAENWPSYRTQIALTSITFLYCCFALSGYCRVLQWAISEALNNTILAAFAFVSFCFAGYNVRAYFAIPQALELKCLRAQIRLTLSHRPQSIYIICPHWYESIAPLVRYDEFGLPFSAQPWAPGLAAYFVLREVNPDHSKIPIKVAAADEPIDIPPGALVVDMRRVRNLR